MFVTFASEVTHTSLPNPLPIMADNTPFNPADLTKFLENAAKESALNANIRSEFKKLQTAVDKFAELFEDNYQPKQRAKRGTGAVAQKKMAQQGGTQTAASGTPAKPADKKK